MKKILGLLLISSSIFSMHLDIVKFDKKAFDIVQFNQQSHKRNDINNKISNINNKISNINNKRNNINIEKSDNKENNNINKVYIAPQSVFIPNQLGSLELSHGKKGFCVHKDGKKHLIERYHTDPMVRNLTKEQLQSFLAVGYFCINQMNNGEFSLKANGRINGGGPILGTIAYWITKSLCYGTVLTAVGTVAVTTAGTGVAAVTGLGSFVAGATVTATAAATTAGAAIGSTAGVVTASAVTASAVATGAGVAAGAVAGDAVATGAGAVAAVATTVSAAGATVAGTSIATAASLTTAAGVTAVAGTGAAATVGTTAATIMAIKSLSVSVGTFFGMLPTP